ncbi:MAG: terpene cyclase/mutase family protein [Planctomycetes bacterium]|nr:terpene cyclase/mutase family protein [Planctomycetota bacterium]
MHPLPLEVRTHGNEAMSFPDLMAEQLRRAPWILLSALLHGTALLLLWALLPTHAKASPMAAAEVQFANQPPLDQPPPPPEPPTVTETSEVTPTIADVDLPATDDATPAESTAFDPFDVDRELASATVGIAGGPRFGPTGRGQRGGPGGGGTPLPACKAIENGLQWLAAHQDDDGRWDADGFMKHDLAGEPCDGPGNPVHDVGVTGLALLAFLGDGSTLRTGPYKENVRRAVRWLREQQHADTGLFGSTSSHDFIYDHAIAAYAMCEAYGLSDSATIKRNAQAGIDYLERHRNPYAVWRYQPRDGDNDASVTGWCVMAYESAKDHGLLVNANALRLAATWIDEATGPDGHCGYQRRGEPGSRHPGDHGTRFPVEKSEAMTAVGLFCRYFLGQDHRDSPVMVAAADRLLQRPPVWDPRAGTIDEYYWYYGTYALYQRGGEPWVRWSKHLHGAVVKTQLQDGNQKGSWDPIGAWGQDGGRVYSTAILTLTLEAHYRYTRLVR